MVYWFAGLLHVSFSVFPNHVLLGFLRLEMAHNQEVLQVHLRVTTAPGKKDFTDVGTNTVKD